MKVKKTIPKYIYIYIKQNSDRSINTFKAEGGSGGGREGSEGGEGGREGGRGGRDDCYTYSNRFVQ